MSESNWYHHKAEECGRLAAVARDPLVREGHLRDQRDWQKIGDQVMATEAALKIKGSK
jgi:hypothetical protein